MTIESKSAFARRRGRTPTAVGQWIKAGLISGAALEGRGRSARINVEIAEAQLAARLDPGQALGNGAATLKAARTLKLSKPSKRPRPSKSQTSKSTPVDDTEDADDEGGIDPVYAREKAGLVRAQREAQEMKNAKERGQLLEADAVDRKWDEVRAVVLAAILAVPGRVRQTHPDLADVHYRAFDAELRQALARLSTHASS